MFWRINFLFLEKSVKMRCGKGFEVVLVHTKSIVYIYNTDTFVDKKSGCKVCWYCVLAYFCSIK